jgi:hypothetical protein
MLLLAAGWVFAAETMDMGVVRNKLLLINDKTDHAVVVGERKFVVVLPPKKNGPTWSGCMDPLINCMFWSMRLEM